jgi:hypothetical protein
LERIRKGEINRLEKEVNNEEMLNNFRSLTPQLQDILDVSKKCFEEFARHESNIWSVIRYTYGVKLTGDTPTRVGRIVTFTIGKIITSLLSPPDFSLDFTRVLFTPLKWIPSPSELLPISDEMPPIEILKHVAKLKDAPNIAKVLKDFPENDYTEDDYIEDDYIEDDYIEDDSTEDDYMGFIEADFTDMCTYIVTKAADLQLNKQEQGVICRFSLEEIGKIASRVFNMTFVIRSEGMPDFRL